jgi:hypothetical protein
MDPTPIDRVASPAEFAELLGVLDVVDALAYGLAGYGMARAAQVKRLRWRSIFGAKRSSSGPSGRRRNTRLRIGSSQRCHR